MGVETPPPLLTVGNRLVDRFVIVGLLGRGAMGEVYEARDEQLEQQVAIKVMRPEVVDIESLARFRREVALARTVTHPNVCRVFDWFRDELEVDGRRQQLIFLTMELLAGGETLAERMRRDGPLRPDVALALVEPIIVALAAAHAVGVVHRDFKSANVIIVPSPAGEGERVVVTDFGMAQRSASKVAPARLTATGHWVGTPAYMAPEQVRGEPVTRRTDVYAFGVTLFEMVTGHLPFDATSAFDAAVRRLSEPSPSPRDWVPDLPLAWEAAIGQCLKRNPLDRFERIEDVLTALRTGSPMVKKPPPWRWMGAGAVVLLVALLLVVLAGVYGSKRVRSPDSATESPQKETESAGEGDRFDGLMRAGYAAFEDGATGEAAATFEEAYVGALAQSDLSRVQRAAGAVAAVLQMRGELRQALKVHERALEHYRKVDARGALAVATFNIGAIRAELGELFAARGLFEEALARYRDEKSSGGEATVRFALGDLEARSGNLWVAIEHYRTAFEARQDLGRPVSAARVATAWAEVEAELGDLPAAHARIDQAVATLRASKGKQGLAPALATTARIAWLEDRLGDARQALEEALAIRRERNDEIAVQQTLCDLAQISIDEGVPALAVPVAGQAADRFADAGLLDAELRARLVLFEAFLRGRDREGSERALGDIRRLARASEGFEGPVRARLAELTRFDADEDAAEVAALRVIASVAESRAVAIEIRLALAEHLLRLDDVAGATDLLDEVVREAKTAGLGRYLRKAEHLRSLAR